MKRPDGRRCLAADAGFSLVELMVVAGMIAVLVAVAAPNIASYMRSAAVRTAATEVKAQIQAARTRAIMKNVNQGVVFVVVTPTTYRYVYEDDVTCVPPEPTPRSITALLATPPTCADPNLPNPQLGPPGQLPVGVVFTPYAGADDSGCRFDRLGRRTDPGEDGKDPIGTGPTVVLNDDNGSWMTVTDTGTGLTRTIYVTPGGQVRICLDPLCTDERG